MHTELDQNHIHVACGIIESNGLVLAAQRGRWMRIPLKWEFPGGKIEDDELPEECLRRELMEELGISVVVERALLPVTHDYPSLRVTLYPYVCRLMTGTPTNHEHEAIVWLSPEQMMTIDWAEADISVVHAYQKTTNRKGCVNLPVNQILSSISTLFESVPTLIDFSLTHDAYLVGGAVRDTLLGIRPLDYDIVVPDDPQALADAVSRKTGVSFFKMGKNRQAVLRGRINDLTIDLIRMADDSIESDLRFRDFTINAMAVHIGSRSFIDPLNGYADLTERRIRMVSAQSFLNDPLRLVRTYRFAATLNFEIERETEAAVRTHCHLIHSPAGERIREEIFRLLNTSFAAAYLQKMSDSGLLSAMFPEFENMSGCTQNVYHRFDVLDHTLSACRYLDSILDGKTMEASLFRSVIAEHRKHLLKLAVLLHDIGKPMTRSVDNEGSVHFIGHEKIGAQMASDIALRLKLSKSDTDYLCELIRCHLRPLLLYRAHQTQSLTRKGMIRLFRSLKFRTPDLLAMALADAHAKTDNACDTNLSMDDFIEDLMKMYFQNYLPQITQEPLITGNDLITRFGLHPSPVFKIILEAVDEARLSQSLDSREQALAWVASWLASHEKGLPKFKKD